jgi:hypothetical protein
VEMRVDCIFRISDVTAFGRMALDVLTERKVGLDMDSHNNIAMVL